MLLRFEMEWRKKAGVGFRTKGSKFHFNLKFEKALIQNK